MNISTLRTRIEAGPAAFGAAALNEGSHRVTEGAEQRSSANTNLGVSAKQSDAEPKCGQPDPLIQALVDRLPKSDCVWSIDERAKWLKAAAMAFNLIYKSE
jgi:hypothetical protein